MENIERHAIPEAIPEAAKEELSRVLFAIGWQLQALRDLGMNVMTAEDPPNGHTMGLCVESISNRAGRLVDAAIAMLGKIGIGGFEDDPRKEKDSAG